jgi:hypothetical protein
LYGGDASYRVNVKQSTFAPVNPTIPSDKKIDYIIIYKEGYAPKFIKSDWKHLDSKLKKVYENNQGVIYKI